MGADYEHLWQPRRPWLTAGRIALLIALLPLFICALLAVMLLVVVLWPFQKMFPPRPSSAQDMVDALTEILTADDDIWALDDAISIAVCRKYSDPRIEALRLRVKRLPELPWQQDTIDELAAMRESARAVAEEATHDR